MTVSFPGVGHRYLADFQSWRVELYFSSDTQLTYTEIEPGGGRGSSETVQISVLPVRTGLFIVRWQEADKTTVVHVEDYRENTIVTNITDPTLAFSQYQGTMTQIA